MEQIYNHPVLTDYVLGLLTPQEKTMVEQHVAHCGRCRQLLEHERQIENAVRETLTAVTQPSQLRLHQLMPAVSQKRATLRPWDIWWNNLNASLTVLKPLAVMGVVVMLFFGSLTLSDTPYPNMMVATTTATSTSQPTATIAQPFTEDNAPAAQPTARPDDQQAPPVATPIAQLAPQPRNN